MTLFQGPSCWDDVILQSCIYGVCQSDGCHGTEAVSRRSYPHRSDLVVGLLDGLTQNIHVHMCVCVGVLHEVCVPSYLRWRPLCGPQPHYDQQQRHALYCLHWHHVTHTNYIHTHWWIQCTSCVYNSMSISQGCGLGLPVFGASCDLSRLFPSLLWNSA